MAGETQNITSLAIDISKLQGQVNQVSEMLKKIGEGYDPSKISKATILELNKVLSAVDSIGDSVVDALDDTAGEVAKATSGIMKTIQKEVDKYNRSGKITTKMFQGLTDEGKKISMTTSAKGKVKRYTIVEKDDVKQMQEVERAYAKLTANEKERARILVKSNSLTNEGTKSATMTLFANNARLRVLKEEDESLKQIVGGHEDINSLTRKQYEAELSRSQNLISAAKYKAKESADKNMALKGEKATLDLYSRQKQIITEMYNIEGKNIRAKANEKASNQERLAVLQNEFKENKDKIDSSEATVKTKEKELELNNLISKKQAELTAKQQAYRDIVESSKRAWEQVQRTLISMATFYGGRLLKDMFKDAVQYATSFYDKLNEIRIVTMMSQEEANRLGDSYRKMAQDMSVTSSQIADAAVEFYRQGLPEDEVNKRLEETIKYAKISGLSFEESAQLITAATNTMSIGAQRVVDVFSYLGDASASGADEVGKAMQKASAAASEFGLSFEWLGSYIATVSEQTREAPEIIGTSFNRILARLHNIKQKGFNEEDETKVNDVAKALNTVNIRLFDQYGAWRDVSDIFIELAGKWSTLNDRQKAYITTTLAGTLQQNKLLALMRDMSKGVEGGSRAFELYAGALDSAGVSATKYAVYEESVQAAQDRLKASLEELYSLINAEGIKGTLDWLGDTVRNFTDGLRGIGGSLFGVEAAILTFGSLAVMIFKAVASFKTFNEVAKGAGGLLGAFSGFKLGPIVGTLTAVVSAITLIYGWLSNTNKLTIDFTKEISKVDNKISSLTSLRDEYIVLADKTTRTTEENSKLKKIVDDIIKISPNLKTSLENAATGFITQKTAASELNAELDKTIQKKRDLQRAQAVEFLNAKSGAEGGAAIDAYKNAFTGRQYQALLDFFDSTGIDFSDMSEYQELWFDQMFKEFTKKNRGQFDTFKPLDMAWQGMEEAGALNPLTRWGTSSSDIVKWFNENETSLRTNAESYISKSEDIFNDVKNAFISQFQDKNFFEMDEASQNEAMKIFQTSFLDTLKLPEGAAYNDEIFNSWKVGADATVKGIQKTINDAYNKEGNLQSVTPDETKLSLVDNVIKALGVDTFSEDMRKTFEEKILNDSELYSSVSAIYDNITKYFAGDSEKIKSELANVLFGNLNPSDMMKYMDSSYVENMAKAYFGDKAAKEAAIQEQQDFLNTLFGAAGSAINEQSANLAKNTGFISQLNQLKDSAGSEESLLNAFKEIGTTITGEILTKYPEVANLVKGIEEGHYNAADAVEAFGDAIVKARDESKKADKDYVDAFSSIGSEIEKVIKVMKKLEKGKEKINFADIQDFLVENPMLSTVLGDTDALKTELTSVFDTLVQKQKDAYSAMMMNSSAFWQNQVSGNTALWQAVSTAYGADANNFNNVASIKADIDAKLRQWIGQGWQTLYGSISAAMSAAANATRGMLGKFSNGLAPGSLADAMQLGDLTNQLAEQMNLGALANQLDNLASILDGIDFDVGDIDFGGGGGGGGGGGKSEVEMLLAKLKDTNSLLEFTLKLSKLKEELHATKGEFTGVIQYLNKQKEVLQAQQPVYQKMVETLQTAIDKKKEEMEHYKEGSKKYNKLKEELYKLMEAWRQYTLALAENENQMAEIENQIEEMENKIRDMEIDIRDEIYAAIEAREERERDMLNSRVDMEDEILAAITARYEAERDMALEVAETQKQALQEQKDLLSEQLRIRKEQSEEEDKQAELAKLESKLAIISADPTRMKEKADLQKQIAELRKEISWDIAEDEVKDQQDALDEQIDSIDEYIESVNAYYEDLFKNPQALIAEMEDIMSKTDEEILAWLSENSEEYRNASLSRQEQMRQDWQGTIDAMHGRVTDYWDEVEAIIAQGEDAILDFLKENAPGYANAGRLQAQAYLDEWRKKLEELRKAHQDFQNEVNGDDDEEEPNKPSNKPPAEDKRYQYGYRTPKGTWVRAGSSTSKTKAFQNAKSAAINSWASAKNSPGYGEVMRSLNSASISSLGSYLKKYRKGGLIDFTGPAIVHGSTTNPESILSAQDTKLIRGFSKVLGSFSRIYPGSFSGLSGVPTGSESNISFGDINLNFDKLDTTTNIKEIARQIKTEIYKEVSKGRPVGGVLNNR